jgi:hypothetical protein
MLHRLLAPALLAAVLLAGCTTTSSNDDSSGRFRGEQRLVANTVEDFESAAAKKDQDRICRDFLTTALVRRLASHGGSCERAVDAALDDADSFGLTVESVRISGDRATARVKADRADHDVMRTLSLGRQGRGWRISAFGPQAG